MKGETNELAKRLNKYTKEQIINAILSDFQVEFILGRIIDTIDYIAQQDLLDEHSKAIDTVDKAQKAYFEWRSEMCDKFGHNGEVRICDIPMEELKKGAKLETACSQARKRENEISKKVDKMLNIGGTK